jgi:hypothetical protein
MAILKAIYKNKCALNLRVVREDQNLFMMAIWRTISRFLYRLYKGSQFRIL